nr:DUF2474 domain-containing protein [Alcaligenes faecalis]
MREIRSRGLWLRRLGWLALIWAGSIAGLTIIALFFRMLMNMAGMTV